MADIELVIKIDEEDYENIKETGFNNNDQRNRIVEAIANGTSLPKDHGRLIDVNEVIKIANKTKDLDGAIWNAPTIIEADKPAIEDAIIEEAEEYESDFN